MRSEVTQITQTVSEREELPTNWGRWGERDERGTLNLITDEVRARAVAEARTGRTVSLARPIPTSPMVAGPMAPLGADSTAVLHHFPKPTDQDGRRLNAAWCRAAWPAELHQLCDAR